MRRSFVMLSDSWDSRTAAQQIDRPSQSPARRFVDDGDKKHGAKLVAITSTPVQTHLTMATFNRKPLAAGIVTCRRVQNHTFDD